MGILYKFIIANAIDKFLQNESPVKLLSQLIDYRLKLLENDKVEQVESRLFTALVKTGIKMANYKLSLGLNSTDIDKICDEICPQVARELHDLRIQILSNINEGLKKDDSNTHKE